MAKKVIGIILIILSVLPIFMGGIFLVVCGILGGTFGIIGNAGGLSVEDGATVESTYGEVYDVSDSKTTICYEVDGVSYMGSLNMTTSEITEGDIVTVEYDSSNPTSFAVPEMNEAFGMIGGIVGGVGVGIGLVCLIPGIAMLVIGIILVKKSQKQTVASAMV